MTWVLVSLAAVAGGLAGGVGLLMAGIRAGDGPNDTLVGMPALDLARRGIRFAVHNRGEEAVLVGVSVRRLSLRLGCAGHFVRVPRRTSRQRWLAGQHTVVYVLGPGERQTLTVPAPEPAVRRGELVVAVGEPDRLRVIHRAIDLRVRQSGAAVGVGATDASRTPAARSAPG